MNKYLIIIEQTQNGFSAYSPDIPGCIDASDSLQDTEKLMKEAMEFHIEGMLEEGLEIPKPTTSKAEFVELCYS